MRDLVSHNHSFAMMLKVIAPAVVCFALFCAAEAHSQQGASTSDSAGYAPSADSVRVLDSAYRARKAQLDKWVHTEEATAHPQEDFISLYLAYGGYLQILPRDLNQYFSECTLRPDPLSDRNDYSTTDRAVNFGIQAQLARSWGIYFEYDLVEKWFNTIVDQTNAQEELDLTEHSFVVGGMYMIYSGHFYRLRVSGGVGAIIAMTTETESPGNYTRDASAIGYQVNFDILNDFRVMQDLSFTLDVLTRTVSTGSLKTAGGQTLDTPFGAGTAPINLKPTASNVVYGLAAGLVYYF
jgi:hypothetical protein